jgi:hypothetical protein
VTCGRVGVNHQVHDHHGRLAHLLTGQGLIPLPTTSGIRLACGNTPAWCQFLS